jgi:hypothetical protein
MLGAQRLIQVGSSLSADGVHPELQLSRYQNAYRPTRNIFAGLRAWPKTLCVFAFLEVRFAGISD